jgi:hypothetical protein
MRETMEDSESTIRLAELAYADARLRFENGTPNPLMPILAAFDVVRETERARWLELISAAKRCGEGLK